ncbi:MAG: hypothetical protein KME03_02490 [Aphanocapsa lilacina HA4352-LM1]|nr:hypothetical protein [Aphanocapsa lilacina HA4352-LM1]
MTTPTLHTTRKIAHAADSRPVCSIGCSHCGSPIAWHRDGTVWHGHCMQCTRTLRGRLGDSGCIEAIYLPQDDFYLSVRGC